MSVLILRHHDRMVRRSPIRSGARAVSRSLLALVAALLMTARSPAQTGGEYDLSWNTVAAGGRMVGEDAEYEIAATLGQPDAGNMSGGEFLLVGGFWALLYEFRIYGDVSEPWGVVDVDDVLYVLDGFVNPAQSPWADIEPCGGDGDVDVDDILAVLGAYSGNPICPPPG